MFSSDTLQADIIDDVPRRRSSIFFPSQSADYQISRKGSVVGVTSPEIDESIHEYTTYQLKLNDQLLKFKVSQLIKVFIIKLKRNSPILQSSKYIRKHHRDKRSNRQKFAQPFLHFISIANLFSFYILFLLTAWTATIN